ncbi:MAG: ATP-binding cassette domain-containing protein [Chloroflexia bacterium]|nr:ATP-binding cassette domain-containing protein [Chloroflexia bacterium]
MRDVHTRYGVGKQVLRAVDGVSFDVERGETVGLVGESGCGKSVTAKTVMKLIDMPPGRIVAGQMWWKGQNPNHSIRYFVAQNSVS